MEAAQLDRCLVFAGFMGAGKSTCAAEAARLLGVPLIDTDERLARLFGEPIEAFWERAGEAAFREREQEVVLEAVGGTPAVVALGGGALGAPAVRDALAAHTVVIVDVALETAWSRVSGSHRPLARDRAAFDALYAERRGVYELAADAVLPRSGHDVLRRALPALTALASGAAGRARLLWALSASGDYPVWVGAGALAVPWPLAAESRRFVLSDANVAELHAGRIPAPAGLIEIAPGEENKTLAAAEAVWRSLVAQGVTRADHLVAVGGGVVGDLAGFCAATYQRGIPIVHVPTTLVAQVDSAYGGKTGVDLPEAKNYVGSYHQPAAVLADPELLSTLAPEEFAAGYAEVVKTALIAGGPLWERIGGGGGVDEDTIFACARTKLGVVAEDERDDGRRQVLNLGHTVAHAVETVTGYRRLRHGEAVGLGLLAALRLSELPELRAQVRGLLEAAGLPVTLEGLDPDAVVEATGRDKKRTGAHVPFVLCRAPGDVRHGAQIAPGAVRAAVAEIAG